MSCISDRSSVHDHLEFFRAALSCLSCAPPGYVLEHGVKVGKALQRSILADTTGGVEARTRTGRQYLRLRVSTSDSTSSGMDIITNFGAASDRLDLSGLGATLQYAGRSRAVEGARQSKRPRHPLGRLADQRRQHVRLCQYQRLQGKPVRDKHEDRTGWLRFVEQWKHNARLIEGNVPVHTSCRRPGTQGRCVGYMTTPACHRAALRARYVVGCLTDRPHGFAQAGEA